MKNDTIPLPNPFPLPKHFGTEIDAALKSKKLTLSRIIKLLTFHFLTRRRFIKPICYAVIVPRLVVLWGAILLYFG